MCKEEPALWNLNVMHWRHLLRLIRWMQDVKAKIMNRIYFFPDHLGLLLKQKHLDGQQNNLNNIKKCCVQTNDSRNSWRHTFLCRRQDIFHVRIPEIHELLDTFYRNVVFVAVVVPKISALTHFCYRSKQSWKACFYT